MKKYSMTHEIYTITFWLTHPWSPLDWWVTLVISLVGTSTAPSASWNISFFSSNLAQNYFPFCWSCGSTPDTSGLLLYKMVHIICPWKLFWHSCITGSEKDIPEQRNIITSSNTKFFNFCVCLRHNLNWIEWKI